MTQELQKNQEVCLNDCQALAQMSPKELDRFCRQFGVKVIQGKIVSRPLSLGSFKPLTK